MKDSKLFSRWIKKSVKDRLFFQNYNSRYFFTDGYTVFTFLNTNKEYVEEAKKVLFQDFTKDFTITNLKIDFENTIKINTLFNDENEAASYSKFIYEGQGKEFKIFLNSKGLKVYVAKNLLDNFSMNYYSVYCSTPVSPVIFKKDDINILVCPTRIIAPNFENIGGIENEKNE